MTCISVSGPQVPPIQSELPRLRFKHKYSIFGAVMQELGSCHPTITHGLHRRSSWRT